MRFATFKKIYLYLKWKVLLQCLFKKIQQGVCKSKTAFWIPNFTAKYIEKHPKIPKEVQLFTQMPPVVMTIMLEMMTMTMTMYISVLREWILKVWEVKVKKFSFTFCSRSETQMPWVQDREWKVKWKCLEIEIGSEKWNENASRSRSGSEISRPISRPSFI